MSKNLVPENYKDQEFENEEDKLDDAFLEMEIIYKTRVVDMPLTSNVKVQDIPKKDE